MDNADRAAELQEREWAAALKRMRDDQRQRIRRGCVQCTECGEPIEAFRRDWSDCCVSCAGDRERWERTTGLNRR